MRVGFLSTDWGDHANMQGGGCTWIRMQHPQMALRNIGVETFIGEIGWDEQQGFVCVHPVERLKMGKPGIIKNYSSCQGNLDVVILKLFMHKDTSEYIKKARALGQTVIIDTDDHFENLPPDNLAFRTTDPKANPENNRNFMIKSYSDVNGIIASTDFLYQRMAKYNKDVKLVENSLFPEHFIKRYDTAKNKPVIGWIGMMLWRVEDIKGMAGVIGPFIESNDLMVHHSGAVNDNPTWFAEALNISPERLTTLPPGPPLAYPNLLMPIDIGLVPLTNNTFNEAKSYLKGLEYVFSNIPFIATKTTEYQKLASNGVGLVAEKPIEWIKHLNYLLDSDNRKKLAEHSYDFAMQNYTIHKQVYKWLDAIISIHENNVNRRG